MIKVLVPGHRYLLPGFEDPKVSQYLDFINKKPAPGEIGKLVTVQDGTTNEAVICVLIDRMNYLQSKFPCRENALAITKLDEALLWLEKRTTDRVARNVEGKHLK